MFIQFVGLASSAPARLGVLPFAPWIVLVLVPIRIKVGMVPILFVDYFAHSGRARSLRAHSLQTVVAVHYAMVVVVIAVIVLSSVSSSVRLFTDVAKSVSAIFVTPVSVVMFICRGGGVVGDNNDRII